MLTIELVYAVIADKYSLPQCKSETPQSSGSVSSCSQCLYIACSLVVWRIITKSVQFLAIFQRWTRSKVGNDQQLFLGQLRGRGLISMQTIPPALRRSGTILNLH